MRGRCARHHHPLTGAGDDAVFSAFVSIRIPRPIAVARLRLLSGPVFWSMQWSSPRPCPARMGDGGGGAMFDSSRMNLGGAMAHALCRAVRGAIGVLPLDPSSLFRPPEDDRRGRHRRARDQPSGRSASLSPCWRTCGISRGMATPKLEDTWRRMRFNAFVLWPRGEAIYRHPHAGSPSSGWRMNEDRGCDRA